jgi:hypothetical protein
MVQQKTNIEVFFVLMTSTKSNVNIWEDILIIFKIGENFQPKEPADR